MRPGRESHATETGDAAKWDQNSSATSDMFDWSLVLKLERKITVFYASVSRLGLINAGLCACQSEPSTSPALTDETSVVFRG